MLWWVFLANGSVLVFAFLLLALSPVTISAAPGVDQLALLAGGLLLMLALNLALLKWVLAPFVHLTEVMGSIDPNRPGTRLAGVHPRAAEGVALSQYLQRDAGTARDRPARGGANCPRGAGGGACYAWHESSTTRLARHLPR